MSSRQEEKAKRKAEREAAEAAAAKAAARKSRIQLVIGGVVAVVAIVAAVVVFGTSGGGSGGSGTKPGDGDVAKVSLPATKDTNLQSAAATAGCTLKTFPSEGREHTTAKVVYKTNPPTSGNHNPVPAEDGIYDQGNPPDIGNSVHSLEHGRIEIQYQPGASKELVNALETVGSEKLQFGSDAYHVLVFQNQTGMKAQVAATAWTQSLTCPKMSDAVYDAIRDFRTEYTDKGPELIP